MSCFRYFRKTGRLSHNFSVVKTFPKCNPLDFKFDLSKLIKMLPIWCNVNFVSVFFVLFIAVKTLKINITPYGENYYLTYRDKI